MGMQWKIALTGNNRRYVDVRSLLRPQPITQRVEDLPLSEASGPGCVVGREILGTRSEGADLELLNLPIPNAIEPSERRRIRPAAMAVAAGVSGDEEPAMRDLVLSRLT